jgi:hypothetical protein
MDAMKVPKRRTDENRAYMMPTFIRQQPVRQPLRTQNFHMETTHGVCNAWFARI